MSRNHHNCPSACDTPCGTLCTDRNAPCTDCDWESEYPYCGWIGERCMNGGCQCRGCDGAGCGECDRMRCGEAMR